MASSPPASAWTWFDPQHWPAAGRLIALAVVCVLCYIYGQAQQANYVQLAERYDSLARECLQVGRSAAEAARAADRQTAAIIELGRRLDAMREALPRRPD